MDLTKIREPFGLLDDETQAALQAHGGPYEVFSGDDWYEGHPSWSKGYAYRAKPQPARKTVYPWDALDDRIKWAAVDQDGWLCLSSEKMKPGSYTFQENSGYKLYNVIKFQRGDEPWQETLQRRPGYEGDE